MDIYITLKVASPNSWWENIKSSVRFFGNLMIQSEKSENLLTHKE
jgi:hypothetical protein